MRQCMLTTYTAVCVGAILGLNEQCQIDDVDTAMHSLGELGVFDLFSCRLNEYIPNKMLRGGFTLSCISL